MPILAEHKPRISDRHPSDLVVGSTGTDAVYQHPYLQNSLVFWRQPAIDAIEKEDQKELSCAYRFHLSVRLGLVHAEHIATISIEKRRDPVVRDAMDVYGDLP